MFFSVVEDWKRLKRERGQMKTLTALPWSTFPTLTARQHWRDQSCTATGCPKTTCLSNRRSWEIMCKPDWRYWCMCLCELFFRTANLSVNDGELIVWMVLNVQCNVTVLYAFRARKPCAVSCRVTCVLWTVHTEHNIFHTTIIIIIIRLFIVRRLQT